MFGTGFAIVNLQSSEPSQGEAGKKSPPGAKLEGCPAKMGEKAITRSSLKAGKTANKAVGGMGPVGRVGQTPIDSLTGLLTEDGYRQEKAPWHT